jgi:hypothetical protein
MGAFETSFGARLSRGPRCCGKTGESKLCFMAVVFFSLSSHIKLINLILVLLSTAGCAHRNTATPITKPRLRNTEASDSSASGDDDIHHASDGREAQDPAQRKGVVGKNKSAGARPAPTFQQVQEPQQQRSQEGGWGSEDESLFAKETGVWGSDAQRILEVSLEAYSMV